LISIDSTVWIAYFNGQKGPAADLLDQWLKEGREITIWPAVVTEVLCGFRSDRDFQAAKKIMLQIPIISHGSATYLQAARLFRSLRKKGITIGTTDVLIAQACIENRAALLTLDNDFQMIANHSALDLAL
jgi:predicted nucleic acid-binding protein